MAMLTVAAGGLGGSVVGEEGELLLLLQICSRNPIRFLDEVFPILNLVEVFTKIPEEKSRGRRLQGAALNSLPLSPYCLVGVPVGELQATTPIASYPKPKAVSIRRTKSSQVKLILSTHI